jgi:hypothetical protein
MLSLRRLACLVFFTLSGGFVALRADDPQFKTGDRVEVDINMNREAADGNWKPGTIRQVDLAARAYRVELDGQPGGADNWKVIPIRTDKWTRRGKPAVNSTPAAAPAARNTAASAQPPAGSLSASTPKVPASNGIKAHEGPHEGTVEHIKARLEADIVFKMKTEWDHVQVTFSSLTLGEPYVEKAKNQSEINSLAYSRRYGVPVTPVMAKFSVLVRSNGGTEHLYQYDRTALWYINTRGECSLSKTGKAIDWVQVR